MAFKLETDEDFKAMVARKAPALLDTMQPVCDTMVKLKIVERSADEASSTSYYNSPVKKEVNRLKAEVEKFVEAKTSSVPETKQESVECPVPAATVSPGAEAAGDSVEVEKPPANDVSNNEKRNVPPEIIFEEKPSDHIAETDQSKEKQRALPPILSEEKSCIEKAAAPYVAAIPVIDYSHLAAVPAEIRARDMKHDVATILMEELNEQTAAFRRELEQSLLKELESLDENQLRLRVAQLTSEFFERTKWEGIRLHQSLRELENDITHRYLDLLAEQRLQLEFEVKKALYAKEKDLAIEHSRSMHEAQGVFELQLQEALRAQAEHFSGVLREKLAAQEARVRKDCENGMNMVIAQVHQESIRRVTDLQEQVSAVESELSVLNDVVDSREETKVLSNSLHKQSAALLALESVLQLSGPGKAELAAMKAACKGDELFDTVLSSIPAAAAAEGIPTLPELRTRFKVVRNEMRKVALAPEAAPKLVGQILGNVLASVSWAPKGYVEGSGLEEVLARSTYLLEQGDLKGAVDELKVLDGYAKVLVDDWQKEAVSRLATDDALMLLRAGAAIRHHALAGR